MLSREEAQAWAEIESRLVEDPWIRSPARARKTVAFQTVAPLLIAGAAALLGLPVPAFLFLFLVPVGLVVHMTQNMPPKAPGNSRTG
ncbi:MAG TPA: hypothetical protein VGH89_01310 [Pseudonocardia sp.]|jgi:hypothetical protein